MIKNTTYIRKINARQRKWLEEVQCTEKIKSVSKILLFALEKFLEQKRDIARLNRIIAIKQKRIEELHEKINELSR